MVKKYLLISALSFALLLSGCRGKMTEGEIYSKRFIPAHTDTMLIPTVYSDGKTSYTILMPYVMTYPDAYEIKIRNYDEDKQKYGTQTYYVKEDVWEQCEIGNVFKYDKDRDFTEMPYSRKEKQ